MQKIQKNGPELLTCIECELGIQLDYVASIEEFRDGWFELCELCLDGRKWVSLENLEDISSICENCLKGLLECASQVTQ